VTPDYAHRRRLIRLMQRKENLELREVLQILTERQGKLNEAQTLSQAAQSEYADAAAAARVTLSPGTQLDIAVQNVTTRSLVDRCRVLSERQRSVERLTEAVESVQRDVTQRRTRIHKLERAEEQADIGVFRELATAQANEYDAIWLGAHRMAAVA